MKTASIAARGSVTGKSTLYETRGQPSGVFVLYGWTCREKRRCVRALGTRKLRLMPAVCHQQALHKDFHNNELNGCTAGALA